MIKTSAHKLSMPAAAAQHAVTGCGTIQGRKILFGWLPRSQNALLEESACECSLDWSLVELVHVVLFLPGPLPSISPSLVLEWACRPERSHADFETEHPYMIVEVDGTRLSRAGPAESLTGQSLTRALVPPDSRVRPASASERFYVPRCRFGVSTERTGFDREIVRRERRKTPKVNIL